MNARVFAAMYVASAREFLRDKLSVIINVLFPMLLAFFFGLIFSGTGGDVKVKMGIVDAAGQGGEAFRQALGSPEITRAVAVSGVDLEDAPDLVAKGALDVVIALSPPQASPLKVTVFYDPTRQMSGGVGRSVVQSLVARLESTMRGVPPLFQLEESPVTPRRRLRQVDFYIPSVLALSFLYLGLFGTAMPLVDLRERKVLRRLGLTPLTRMTLLASQVTWRVTLAVVQAGLFVLIGFLVFRVPVGHDWPGFAGLVLLGALTFVALGYFMASVSRNQESAVALLQLVNLPMTMLSGTMFAAEFLPAGFRLVVNAMPLTYLGDGLRQTMVGFAPLFPLWVDFAVLGGWLVAFVVLGALLFRWD